MVDEGQIKTQRPPEIHTYKYFKTDPQFIEFFGEDENIPTVLRKSDDSIDIHINMENLSYKKLLENVKKLSSNEETFENISNEYVTQIAFYSLLIYINNKDKTEEEQIDEDIINEELKRTAILITSMINDNLKIYIVESKNEVNGNI